MTTRRRRKPPMPDCMRATVEEARKRVERRPLHPGVRVEVRAEERGPVQTFGPVHRDFAAWESHIRDAFGTCSVSVYLTFLGQLADLCGTHWNPEIEAHAPNEVELNAALAVVYSVRPRNEIEAMMAAQMVAVHLLTMRLAAQIGGGARGGWINPQTAGAVGKLARTFVMQCEALAKLRGKTAKQHIKVSYERHDHKHVHVEAGGRETVTQAQAPERADIECRAPATFTALPGPDAGRDALSGAGGERQGAVPHARRR